MKSLITTILILFGLFNQIQAFDLYISKEKIIYHKVAAILLSHSNGEVVYSQVMTEIEKEHGLNLHLEKLDTSDLALTLLRPSGSIFINSTYYPIRNNMHLNFQDHKSIYVDSMNRYHLVLADDIQPIKPAHFIGVHKMREALSPNKDYINCFINPNYAIFLAFRPHTFTNYQYYLEAFPASSRSEGFRSDISKQDLKECTDLFSISLPYFDNWQYKLILYSNLVNSPIYLDGYVIGETLKDIPIPEELDITRYDLVLKNDYQSYYYSDTSLPDNIPPFDESTGNIDITPEGFSFDSLSFNYFYTTYFYKKANEPGNRGCNRWFVMGLYGEHIDFKLPLIPDEIKLLFPALGPDNKVFEATVNFIHTKDINVNTFFINPSNILFPYWRLKRNAIVNETVYKWK